MSPRVLLRGLLFIASLALLGYVLETTQIGSLLSEKWVDSQIRGHGAYGELLYLGVGAVAAAAGLPRQFVSFLGGYAFGFWMGTVYAVIASLLGCALAFFYARFLGRVFISSRFSGRIQRMDDFLSEHPFSMALLIRLLPVGSNLVTNLVAGVASVRALPFFAGSAIGYIPQTMVFVLLGSGADLSPVARIGLAVGLFVVSGALGAYLYRHFRHGKRLDDQIDRELG